jgi:hypothetical protein
MKTILFHTKENTVLGWFESGYKVNGKPSPTFDPDVVELTVVETEPPEYNPETHSLGSAFVADFEEKTYTKVWSFNPIPEVSMEEHNTQMQQLRAEAYKVESDPLALKYLRDECTKQDWLDKIAEIRVRYPYKTE